MNGQKIGYVRVSSNDQNPERQLENMTLDRLFIEKASGKDLERPQLSAMKDFIREGDILFIHSLDRLARNLDDLRKIVKQLTDKGVEVHFVKEGLIYNGNDSSIANLMLSVLGGFAEFERAIIRERQSEGIALAKEREVYKGRRKKVPDDKIPELIAAVKAGLKSKVEIAKDFGICRDTLYTYIKTN